MNKSNINRLYWFIYIHVCAAGSVAESFRVLQRSYVCRWFFTDVSDIRLNHVHTCICVRMYTYANVCSSFKQGYCRCSLQCVAVCVAFCISPCFAACVAMCFAMFVAVFCSALQNVLQMCLRKLQAIVVQERGRGHVMMTHSFVVVCCSVVLRVAKCCLKPLHHVPYAVAAYTRPPVSRSLPLLCCLPPPAPTSTTAACPFWVAT